MQLPLSGFNCKADNACSDTNDARSVAATRKRVVMARVPLGGTDCKAGNACSVTSDVPSVLVFRQRIDDWITGYSLRWRPRV